MAQVADANGAQTTADPALELTRINDIFPDLDDVKKFVKDGDVSSESEAEFEQSIAHKSKYMQDVLRHRLIKEKGNQKFACGRYDTAISHYIRAAAFLLTHRGTMRIPSFEDEDVAFGMYSGICAGTGYSELFYFLALATCYNNIALCCIKQKKRLDAIDWTQETLKMYILREESNQSDNYPWVSSYPRNLEFFTYFIKFQTRLAEIFLGLKNTASAAHCSYLCSTFGLDKSVGSVELETLRAQAKGVEDQVRDMAVRHPSFKGKGKGKGRGDAGFNNNINIVDPELQIRGVWRRLHARRGYRPRNRSGFSSWIWRGSLYVYGGIDYCRKAKRLLDLWCLDLAHMDAWRRLPDTPRAFYPQLNYIMDTRMRVWEDAAWLFVGSRVVFKFDMLQERWVRVNTRWSGDGPWPYAKNMAIEYCAEIFENQLHIFGGADSLTSAGVSLHMCLDLDTLVWTKLGGTVHPRERVAGMPMFRKACGSWVVPPEKRMYVLYGYASITNTNATATDSEREGRGSRSEHQCEDMWSYSFVDKRWRPERFRGNFPAPRVKMACVYLPGLQQVLLFGGGNLRLQTFDEEERTRAILPISYLGDTFVLDVKTRIWRQVLTRNFPHHRFYAQLNVDAETGKIYLYGGSCSTIIMPMKNADKESKTVSLGDLWQLNLDLPGQNFDLSEFYSKTPVRGFGPWKLCFGCKEYKAGIKKCGGTCAGQIYICSVDCQKQSWKEHKRVHHCSRF